MNSLWFSSDERALMATPVIERILRAIKDGRTTDALPLCDLLKNERIVLHDFFADACTALFTWVSRTLGEDSLPAMFSSCFENSARRQVLDLLALGLDRGIEAVMLARSCWIAHGCSGAGEHGGAFRLIEDDEKFTFEMDPCGSGGRLWRRGRYDPPFGMAVTSKPHPWSYNRGGFPVYCVHCAFLNEILPHRYLGHASWPVDPPEHAGDICRWHLYKDPDTVPDSYYARLSLDKNRHKAAKPGRRRFFTDEEREELSTPTPDRLHKALQHGNLRRAMSLCVTMADEFLFLHNLFVNMIATTLDFAAENTGEERLGDLYRFLYEKCIEQQLTGMASGMSPAELLSYVVHNYFLAGTCGGVTRIAIREDDEHVSIRLAPCPGGGRLMNARAYRPVSTMKRIREKFENRMLKLALAIPLPRSVLVGTLPYAVRYFTETRKPARIGIIGKTGHVKRGAAGMLRYCAMCTSFVHHSGYDWIEVRPPGKPGDSCVWLADKRHAVRADRTHVNAGGAT